jgi:plasmid maintenance system killer protein
MQITYASKTIQRLCEEDKHQRKHLGKNRAKRLKNRLNELRAVANVSQLQLGRPHPLSGDRAGQFSVDLDGRAASKSSSAALGAHLPRCGAPRKPVLIGSCSSQGR